jgi:hypothetical protein
MSTDGIELFTGDEILDQLVRREGPDGLSACSTLGRGIRCPASPRYGSGWPTEAPVPGSAHVVRWISLQARASLSTAA